MRILIVGSLCGYATQTAKIALSKGAKVMHSLSIEEALNCLRSGKGADLVLVEAKLDLKKFISHLKQERIVVEVIACGINSEPEEAALSIKEGAREFLSLPPDPELISSALKLLSPAKRSLICEDPKMFDLLDKIQRVVESDAHVLLTGESGTGKELIARYIHEKSLRSEAPFIAINCAAIPEMLLESELFGHEKGAFTGAITKRIGKFEEAHKGTLLLDEVTEMDLRLQAKLLRAIQEQTIDRVGGSSPIDINIRIIATSNRNMIDAIESKNFREDLYFRLNVINFNIPPLRERQLDIIPLSNYFCEKYSKINNKQKKNLSKNAVESLLNHSWPGNIRELENTIHRSVLFSKSQEIEPCDLFENISLKKFNAKRLEDVEKDVILKTLAHCVGNKTHAATILGISIRTLRNKLKEYNLERDAS